MKRRLAITGIGLVVIALLLVARNAFVDDPLERLHKTGDAYEGSWKFVRGGPYMLGFESPRGPATLSIDGRVVARGQGQKLQRVVFLDGVVSVRFEAPPGARLLWHPPGRRGPPEYVPASSLSPEPPDRASFSGAGASLADGVFALLIAAVLAIVIAVWARARARPVDRTMAKWCGAVFALALLARIVGLGSAGQTWDEDVNWSAGRNYVTNFLSLDFSESSWQWNYQHPPVMKYVAGIGAQLADGYGPARFLSALMVAFACALLVPIGSRLFSLRVGVLAGAVAALTPHLIAHGKVVGHEAPTILLWTLAVYLCLRAHDGLEVDDKPARKTLAIRFAVIGAVLGLAIFSRFVNGLLAPLIGVILVINAPRALRVRTVVYGLAIIPVAAAIVGFAIWPRMWSEPITHLQQSWAKLKQPHSAEPYLGHITNAPPRSYFFVYFFATAPLGLLVGGAAFLARAAARREKATLVVVLLWLIPFGVMVSPVRQDGIRYITPSLVALALAAAAGFDWVVSALRAKLYPDREGAVFSGVAGALGLYLIITCARIHPYYLDYYGEHVGGPAAVARARAFEIAWWGEGLGEALDYINREAPPGARVYKRCVEPSHLAWLRGDLWLTEAHNPERADWYLVYQPSWKGCPVPGDAHMVYEVTAQGAPLVRVYRRSP